MTDPRLDLEACATLLLDLYARKQLGLPKNRRKGVALPPLPACIRAAQEELDEALHAHRSGLGTAALLGELGDAAAWAGLAMVVAVRERDDA